VDQVITLHKVKFVAISEQKEIFHVGNATLGGHKKRKKQMKDFINFSSYVSLFRDLIYGCNKLTVT
jgi:hypothetical protein